MKQVLAFVLACSLVGCGGSDNDQTQVDDAAETENTIPAIHGVWSGNLTSEFNGSSESTRIFIKNETIIAISDGNTGFGKLQLKDGAYTANLDLLGIHYPAPPI